jgi:hypothetical protein
MASAADIVLKDASGANVTFNPYAVREDSVEWVEAGATSILGTTRAVLSRKIPADRSAGVYRTAGKLTRPVVNVTTGGLDGVNMFTFEHVHPAKLLASDANETMARGVAFAGLAIVKTAAGTGAIPT